MKAGWDFKVARSEIAMYMEQLFKAIWVFKPVWVHFRSHVNVLLVFKLLLFSISSILLLHLARESLVLLHSCIIFISLLKWKLLKISWGKKICRVSILFVRVDVSPLDWILSFAGQLFVVSLTIEFSSLFLLLTIVYSFIGVLRRLLIKICYC